MTREDIIRMALEAGCEIRNGHIYHQFSLDKMLKRFAQAAYAVGAAAERQNICKQIAMLHDSLALASDPGGLKMRGNK